MQHLSRQRITRHGGLSRESVDRLLEQRDRWVTEATQLASLVSPIAKEEVESSWIKSTTFNPNKPVFMMSPKTRVKDFVYNISQLGHEDRATYSLEIEIIHKIYIGIYLNARFIVPGRVLFII